MPLPKGASFCIRVLRRWGRAANHLFADGGGVARIYIDQIDVVQGDTDLAVGFGSVGSRSLFVGGTAVAVSTND